MDKLLSKRAIDAFQFRCIGVLVKLFTIVLHDGGEHPAKVAIAEWTNEETKQIL